jgi:hypothetical protein
MKDEKIEFFTKKLNSLRIKQATFTSSGYQTPAYLEKDIRLTENGLMKVGTDYEHTKLSEDDVKYIRENYIPKHPEYGGVALSKKFNVGSAQISRIVNNTRWTHL